MAKGGLVRGRTERAHHRRAIGAALALILAAPPVAPATARQQVPTPAAALDFSAVTTRAAAGRLVRKHLLVKIHLVPAELGGPKAKVNIGYVTPEAARAHAQFVEMLAVYAQRDLVDHIEIEPDYNGLSIVPTRLRIKVSHSRGGESFERVIEIWDCGLCPPLDPLPDPDGPGTIIA
ncbi:MAG: hypothetical protein ABW023_09040 [Sphingomonas sp.]